MAGWREQSRRRADFAGQNDRRIPGSTPPGFTPEEWALLLSGVGSLNQETQGLLETTRRDEQHPQSQPNGNAPKEIGHGRGTWFGEKEVVDPRDPTGKYAPKSTVPFIRKVRATRPDWTKQPKH